MNDANLLVLTNIIGAVESGGQIYGKRRYNAYADPYTNSAKETTITIGWAQCFDHEARALIQGIFNADPAAFRKLDTCTPRIESMLPKSWGSINWKPSASQKKVIIALIDSAIGHKVQDDIFIEKMKKLVADCAADYTSDIKAQMMYCEIRHLGGRGPCDRIFKRCDGKYDLDTIMASLARDQQDKSSDNQVGDTKYWSRHLKCRQYIDQYAVDESSPKKEEKKEEVIGMTVEQAIDAMIALAEEWVGYHEKASGNLDYLYTKDKNNGSANYTCFNYEMHKIQPRNMDYPGAWCNAFFCFLAMKCFGVEVGRKVLCGDYDDYTPNSSNLYKKAGRWSTTPHRGDQAFFRNSERICHTGLVYKVDGKKVYTIEGNAGNEVRLKSYTLGDSYIAGFGQPLYSAASDQPIPKPSYKEKVQNFQKWLNANYTQILKTANVGQLVVDGDYGPKTRAAAIAVWKYMANKYYGATLTIGNTNFLTACKQAAAKMTDAEVKAHYTLQEIQIGILAGKGYDSLANFRKAKNVSTPADTWYALFN